MLQIFIMRLAMVVNVMIAIVTRHVTVLYALNTGLTLTNTLMLTVLLWVNILYVSTLKFIYLYYTKFRKNVWHIRVLSFKFLKAYGVASKNCILLILYQRMTHWDQQRTENINTGILFVTGWFQRKSFLIRRNINAT